MANRRHMPIAAAITVVAALSIAAPASAAETTTRAGEAPSVTTTNASTVRHGLSRIAAWREHRYDRYVRPIRSGLGCSSAWCGRQFVLMLGIAY